MDNQNIPSHVELPSTATLVRSTVLAALTAVVLLVTVVLPAEYAIDPTGIGRVLGLQQMGEIKRSLAEEAAAARSAVAQSVERNVADAASVESATEVAPQVQKHEMEVTLGPNESTEIKVAMAKGSTVQFEWWTDGGPASFDVHGDSKEQKINYHGYSKGSEQKGEGVIEAAFDGHHGWYWKNRTRGTMTVTLQTNGEYTDIKHMK
jgi:hypothetical protein